MKTSLTLIALLLAQSGLFAQRSITLADALKLGQENSYQMRTARLDLESARSKVKEITSIGLPQINAGGSFTNFIDIPVQVIPDFVSPAMLGTLLQLGLISPDQAQVPESFIEAQFGTKFNTSAEISANQLIFDGTYLVGLQAARSYVGFSETMLQKSEIDVRAAVRNAYYTALLAEENAKVLRDSKEIVVKTLSDTQALFKAGFVEQTDEDQLSLTLAQLDSQVKLAESQAISAKNFLKFQMGLPVTEQIILADPLSMHVGQAIDEALLITAFNSANTIEHRITDTNVLLQTLLLRKEKAAHIPSLSAFFTHSQSALRNEFDFFDSQGDWFPSTFWGISLNVPIWSSGMRHQKVSQAAIEVKKAEIVKEQTMEGLNLEFENAKSEYVFALENYTNAQKAGELAKKIHDRTLIKYKEGVSTGFELTQSENQQLTAQGQLLAANLRLLQAKTSLDKLFNRL